MKHGGMISLNACLFRFLSANELSIQAVFARRCHGSAPRLTASLSLAEAAAVPESVFALPQSLVLISNGA